MFLSFRVFVFLSFCIFVFLSRQPSDQMSEGSEVSKVTLCVKILKWHWPSHSPPRSGIELPGQLKRWRILIIDKFISQAPLNVTDTMYNSASKNSCILDDTFVLRRLAPYHLRDKTTDTLCTWRKGWNRRQGINTSKKVGRRRVFQSFVCLRLSILPNECRKNEFEGKLKCE